MCHLDPSVPADWTMSVFGACAFPPQKQNRSTSAISRCFTSCRVDVRAGSPVRTTDKCRLEETFGCLRSHLRQQAGPISKFYWVVLFLQINSEQTHDPTQKRCSSEAGNKCLVVRLFLPPWRSKDVLGNAEALGERQGKFLYAAQMGAAVAGSPWPAVSSWPLTVQQAIHSGGGGGLKLQGRANLSSFLCVF